MASDDIPIGPDESAVPLTADQLYDALLRIPSQFERLVYLASLATSPASNWQTGDTELFWREVRSEHVTVFEGWLALSIREKQADIELFAASQGRSASGVLLYWSKPKNHKDLLPPRAEPSQRELLAMELEVLFMVV